MKQKHLITLSFLGFSLCLSSHSFAADTQRSVTVSGECLHSLVTDRTEIILTAESKDKDLKVATKTSTRIYEKVRQAIEKMSLENLELSTVESSLVEDREYVKDHWVKKGFRSRMGLRVVTSSTDKMGEVIALAAREEVQDIGALNSFLSDEKMRSETRSCLKEAAEDARAKATKLTEALGAHLGDVITISESSINVNGPREPMPMAKALYAADESMGGRGGPKIEASRQSLKVDVNVSFGIKN